MANLFGWLMTFFLLVSLLAMVGYQLICFADLEFDHINVYEFSTRVNKVVMPEFVIQAVFSLVALDYIK
ncbi:Cornichon [Corchorus capsularis]|uniref:Cornichon n=1 Tax=Corchorus capsularis TaxID=210143 RepID=A0A1R3I7L1_COCAP|nr:Cornichon [Corchorus capsularis]